jgi:methionyl-tRNA formyltransferase
MAERIAGRHELVGVVREEKGLKAFYDDHPDRELIADHFKHLADTEASFFGACSWDAFQDVKHTVERGNLSTEAVAERVQQWEPDAVAVFGCGIIKSPVIEQLPAGRTFNLHQGLSPYYRGSGTNFWPFVEGRLEYIGVTLHLIDPGIDTGGIVAHGRPAIERDDDLHTIGCKTIEVSADLLLDALEVVESGGTLYPVAQWDKGTLYKRVDLDGAAIQALRDREASGFVANFVKKREEKVLTPIQLVTLER